MPRTRAHYDSATHLSDEQTNTDQVEAMVLVTDKAKSAGRDVRVDIVPPEDLETTTASESFISISIIADALFIAAAENLAAGWTGRPI